MKQLLRQQNIGLRYSDSKKIFGNKYICLSKRRFFSREGEKNTTSKCYPPVTYIKQSAMEFHPIPSREILFLYGRDIPVSYVRG